MIYAEDAKQAHKIQWEAEVAKRIGLPVTLTHEVPLPFEVAAALSFEGQATFAAGRSGGPGR